MTLIGLFFRQRHKEFRKGRKERKFKLIISIFHYTAGFKSCLLSLISYLLVLGSWFLVPGSYLLVLGSWFLVLVSCLLSPA